jgi:hypothetical protein
MSRNMNPPIPGHGLLHEGHAHRNINDETDDYFPAGHPDSHSGGCYCGAKPPDWPNTSINATKRWHREHKAALREAAS